MNEKTVVMNAGTGVIDAGQVAKRSGRGPEAGGREKPAHKKKGGETDGRRRGRGIGRSRAAESGRGEALKSKKYEKELAKLQGELCALQEWVKHKGLRVIVVFGGRDAAGKAGDQGHHRARQPRVFRLVALPAPSDARRRADHMQRYIPHFPPRARS
jgi:polyphosphate kinase 2 (PPK2 family)